MEALMDLKELVESLRSIHRDVKVTTEREFMPVGELMHDAADAIEKMEKANLQQEKKIAEFEYILSEIFPIK